MTGKAKEQSIAVADMDMTCLTSAPTASQRHTRSVTGRGVTNMSMVMTMDTSVAGNKNKIFLLYIHKLAKAIGDSWSPI